MIFLDYPNKDVIAKMHYDAVEDYVSHCNKTQVDQLYSDISKILTDLPVNREEKDFTWLRRFILADCKSIESWTVDFADNLKFLFFKNLYLNRFAKDAETFVDQAKTYNAYTMLRNIQFSVCPYCDEEYIDIFTTLMGDRRTSDIDHFHPKGKEEYPGLAMCFYNLIPSGKGCNQTMNITSIEANPYNPDIETWSKFYQDTPPGRNPDSLSDDEVNIRLQTSNGMTRNNAVLGIEQRYSHRKSELKRLFKLKYLLQPENIKEKERLGISIDTIIACLGERYPADRGKSLHQKLRYDLLGF